MAESTTNSDYKTVSYSKEEIIIKANTSSYNLLG